MSTVPDVSTDARNLAAWDRYLKLSNDGERDDRSQAAFDFQARWRFASSFEGIKAIGYKTDGIVDGYHALLKLVVVCTAREQLAVVLGQKRRDLRVDDHVLADAIRVELYRSEQTRFAGSLQKGAKDTAIERLEPFWRGESSDVQEVAFAIRNGVAHGSITPTGSEIRSPKRIQIIIALGAALLEDSDRVFSHWVETIASRGLMRPVDG